MRVTATILISLALSTSALAQHHGHQRHQQHAPGPYVGLQQREVKALSEQQITDLRQGRGMGFALAAELNGYPGPMHVLELKDQLQLTAEQHQRFQQLFDSMKAEAIAAGEVLIASERALDRAFSEGTITSDKLAALTAEVGTAQGRLRAVHMKYHLSSADLLSHQQRQRYADLRGYR